MRPRHLFMFGDFANLMRRALTFAFSLFITPRHRVIQPHASSFIASILHAVATEQVCDTPAIGRRKHRRSVLKYHQLAKILSPVFAIIAACRLASTTSLLDAIGASSPGIPRGRLLAKQRRATGRRRRIISSSIFATSGNAETHAKTSRNMPCRKGPISSPDAGRNDAGRSYITDQNKASQ